METPGDGEVRTPALGSILTAATYLLELIVVAASYFGLAAANLLAPSINPAMTPLWPPTGIALALVLLRGNQIWPAILVGSFAPYLIAGRSVLEAGSIGIGTLLAAFSGASLISRWSNGPNTFATPFGIAKFALISIAPTAMISSTIALAGFTLANAAAFADPAITWITWWLADTTGILIIVPVVVLWTITPLRPFSKWSLLETVAVFVVVSAIGIVAYSPLIGSYLIRNDNVLLAHRSLVGFIVLLPLLWAGLRGNQRTVATAAIIFCAIAMWGYSAGSYPFQKTDLNGALLSLFVLSMSVSVPPLVLAATIATRRNTEARLLSVQDQLNRQIKQTNLALDSANRHFQILIEGVSDYAIFMLDTAGRVGSWNNAAQRIMGYTAEEIIGKHFGIFYRPDERRTGEPNRALELAIQKGKHEVEGWHVRKNGTPFFVTGSVFSIRGDDGNLVGFANVLRDATERRDAQEKLVQAREQLAMAQKMEAIGKLTGGIAHDFNNLLMIIGGNAQTFKRLLDPKLPKAIEAIQTAAKRGESLTRQLLTFSSRQQLTPTVVDLNASIKNMRTMIESSLRGNIVYNENIGDSVWPVKVDLAELELTIVNIAVNARDAMPNGGTFTLSVQNMTARQEAGDDRTNGTFVAVQFSDTGMGIPPNLLSKIFDPFFTTKEVGKGTGLGLSQVYGFAHQAGGTVTAESQVGKGTTITLYLPASIDEQITSKEVSATDTQDSQRPTVLIVDDSADVAEVTSSLFENLGYKTIYRDSAEAALRLLAEGTRIDLVFSDIVMPGAIDGVGLAIEIRSQYPDLPVVLTTGYSDAAQAAPSYLRILRKPFDTDALKNFIQNVTEVA
ncbi:MAG: MASE1 domain-containing protein [Pseudolabrys sp.]